MGAIKGREGFYFTALINFFSWAQVKNLKIFQELLSVWLLLRPKYNPKHTHTGEGLVIIPPLVFVTVILNIYLFLC